MKVKIVLCLLCMTLASFAVPQKRIEMSVQGYTGVEILEDFPVLVRLSENANGFLYSDCHADGYDIVFKDVEGNTLSHEIDVWNPTGESTIWVKLPRMIANTVFYMYYNESDATAIAGPDASVVADVWSKYSGVWHIGTQETDSTGHGLAVTGLNTTVENDPLTGKSVKTSSTDASRLVLKSSQNKVSDINKQTISMWVKPAAKQSASISLLHNRVNNWDAGFWWGIDNKYYYVRASNRWFTVQDLYTNSYLIPNEWTQLTARYDYGNISSYANGNKEASGNTTYTISSTNGNKDIYVGSSATTTSVSECFVGYIDELRFFDGVASDSWIKAEYDSIVNSEFISIGTACDVSFASEPQLGAFEYSFDIIQSKLTIASRLLSGNIANLYFVRDDASEVLLAQNLDATSAAVAIYADVDVTTDLGLIKIFKIVAEYDNGATETIRKVVDTKAFYFGSLAVTKIQDADEKTSTSGIFEFTRSDAAFPLDVYYSVSGTAISGQTYETLSGVIRFRAGESSRTVEVVPMRDWNIRTDSTVDVIIVPGYYGINPSTSSSSSSVTIVDLVFEEGVNIWLGMSNSDASVAENWSLNRVPLATDDIVLDGLYSQAAMTWDATSGVLPNNVASWTQRQSYTNAVEISTTYPEYSDVFTCFTINGNLVLEGGSIVPKLHDRLSFVLDNSNRRYRLKLNILGNATIGSAAKITATQRGYLVGFGVYRGYVVHGGVSSQPTSRVPDQNYVIEPFGNLFEPIDIAAAAAVGCDANPGNVYETYGGGAVYLTVEGTLTNNGSIEAIGGKNTAACGAGGSVYVNAASITGNGTFNSSAGEALKSDGAGGTVAPGGRLAVIARDNSIVPSTQLICNGSKPDKKRLPDNTYEWYYAAPGTIYFENSDSRTLFVKNLKAYANDLPTMIPSADDPNDWRNQPSLDIVAGDCSHIQFSRDIVANSLYITTGSTKSDIDLAGKIIRVSSVNVGGTELPQGTYTLENAASYGIDWLKDSSDDPETTDICEATGALIIGNSATVIIIK